MTNPGRRPIAARNTGPARAVARWLAGTAVTPNQISAASVVFGVLAGLAFWGAGELAGWPRSGVLIAAALCCQLRLLCNLFDGMVAVEGGKNAPDGPFWNETPDRAADIAILVGLGLGTGLAALGWAAAAMAVLTAYVRELGQGQGMPADFSGPMAKPHRMALVTGAALVAAVIPEVGGIDVLAAALWVVTLGAAITVLRRSWRLVRWLKER